MKVPIWVEQNNGTYWAIVPGVPQLRAVAATADLAVSELIKQLRKQMKTSQLVFVNLELDGLLGLAGKYKDDPTLSAICKEAYRQRDAERDAEFAEADSPTIADGCFSEN